jgi:hypothetical protein
MDRPKTSAGAFEGMVPVRLHWKDAQPQLQWLQLGKVHYAEPFFELTIGRCRSQPVRIASRESSLDELVAAQEREPGPRPAGFIFHMSRCGSTLVAQLLASLPRATVISEAPPIDAVLRAHLSDPAISEQRRIRWLQALLGALGAGSTGEAKRYFVKFDAWNVMELPLIHRAFPEVPWVFLCREPLQVMQSHARMCGSHMAHGVLDPRTFGWNGLPQLPVEEYRAEVLAKICDAAIGALSVCGKGAVLDYRDLPEAAWSRLLDFFGIEHSAEEVAGMREASRLDAKQSGQQPFDVTAAASRPAASPVMMAAVERRLRHSYQSLLAAATWGEYSPQPECVT